jgi:hypothetical protein
MLGQSPELQKTIWGLLVVTGFEQLIEPTVLVLELRQAPAPQSGAHDFVSDHDHHHRRHDERDDEDPQSQHARILPAEADAERAG